MIVSHLPDHQTILRFVERTTKSTLPMRTVEALQGQASSRSYFRVANEVESFVVMVMDTATAFQSEEGGTGGSLTELPFVNVQRYLTRLGVRVPRIFAYDARGGMMVTEDLGDVTLERALQTSDFASVYVPAVRLAAHMRASAERDNDRGCVAYSRSFDEDLYEWELQHFREWGLELWSADALTSEDRRTLDSAFREVAIALSALPRGFTHRDFQSRNLMVKDRSLVLIDFQDALLGPRLYDLVALLRDSYVELPGVFVDQMLDEYLFAMREETGEAMDRAESKRTFDLLTVQRKLKDAGRFEFIHRVKGNPNFLPAIAPSLRYVRLALCRLPELRILKAVIDRYLPEA